LEVVLPHTGSSSAIPDQFGVLNFRLREEGKTGLRGEKCLAVERKPTTKSTHNFIKHSPTLSFLGRKGYHFSVEGV